jgi:protein SCO1
MTMALQQLAAVDAAAAERVVPLFISIDHERDRPHVLKSYVEQFHPRMIALTGTLEELRKVARSYGVLHAKVPSGTSESHLMYHTSFIYLMDREGRYMSHFERDVSVEELVDGLRKFAR